VLGFEMGAGAGFGCDPAGFGTDFTFRLLNHSSRKEFWGCGGVATAAGLLAAEVAPGDGADQGLAFGRIADGGGAIVFMRSKISASTLLRGLPYLAADNCFNAADKRPFDLPSGGKVAIENGCVGTPFTKVLTIVL
jgi:hypothetical protein